MFRNVLVGVNENDSSQDTIALARMLVAHRGALTLAHVFHNDPFGTRGLSDPELLEKRERAAELLERAAEEAGIHASLRWRGAASVGRGLHELAESIEADLLVVGSSRHGLLGRVRLADDTRSALNGAPCAVAVAPAGYASESSALMREIGVAYDGSPESEHALDAARTFAAELGASLSAFQAVSVPAFVAHGRSAVDGTPLETLVDRARAQIAAHEGVETHAAYGDPVEELTLFSASLDLLVVGSRSYGPLGRLVHGSTAQHLARTARCPLLVLTRGARKGAPASVFAEDWQGTASTAG